MKKAKRKSDGVRPRNAEQSNTPFDDEGDVSESCPLPSDKRLLRSPLPEVDFPADDDFDESGAYDIVEPSEMDAAEPAATGTVPTAASNDEGGVQTPDSLEGVGQAGEDAYTADLRQLIGDPVRQANLQLHLAEKNLMLLESIAKSLMGLEVIFSGVEKQLLMLTELQVAMAKGRF